ncbi:MAG: BrnA antitoxin family protein [Reyranella sp.]|jgi:uncharacterized protein (DUF4415 family)|nr:BrnA antitoxin family protein [Reyranella sp.]
MPKRKPLTDAEGEVRELTGADFKAAKRFSALPKGLQKKLQGVRRRGPQKAPTKELISIRLSRDVLAGFRAGGPGWQGRIEEALKRSLARARHPR